MANISRRDFLKYVGAGGTGAVGGFLYAESVKQPVEYLIPEVETPAGYLPGVAQWYNTTCGGCAASCGISVRTREGRAKKIEGNRLHPVNQGGLCAMGQAQLNALYNPDRIRAPMRRDGDGFVEITWDEALTTLGSRLATLRISGKAERVRFLSGEIRGHVNSLVARFMSELGSPHYQHWEFTHPAPLYAANLRVYGEDALPYYDIGNARVLFSFGADLAGTWLSPVHYARAFGRFRRGDGRPRGHLVQIEPRMSNGGAVADEWIPARPGSEGLLALALCHELLGSYRGDDKAAWEARLQGFAPEDVAGDTGVDADAIRALAQRFAGGRPALAIAGGAALAGTAGLATSIAVSALNHLAGSVGRAGGVIFNPEPPVPSETRFASFADMQGLSDDMRDGAVDVLLVHDTNPAFTLPAGTGFAQALDAVPMVVAMSCFMDETTARADLILPTDTSLEAWGDDYPAPGVGFAVASISQPVVRRLYDTRSIGDIVLEMAHQIGGELPQVMPWRDTEEYLRSVWRGLYDEHGGKGLSGFDDFWTEILKAGVWGIRGGGRRPTIPMSADFVTRPQTRFAGDAVEFPFHLHPFVSHTFGDGRGANLPWLQEMPDPMTSIVYDSWVELNPQTATSLNVKEGSVVEVSSPAGSLRAAVFVTQGIRPDVVAMPIGQGHSDYGRYARGRGANPLAILAPETDDEGALAWAATRVKLAPTGERIEFIKTDGTTRTLGRQILGPAGHGGHDEEGVSHS